MKTTFAVMLCVFLLLFSACAQKVNDPADVQAIEKSVEDYTKAFNAADLQGSVAAMTGKTVFSVYNTPVAVGTEAIRSLFQGIFSYCALELNMPVEDVRVVGDLAVARINWAAKFTPKSQGVAPFSDSGSQIVVLTRQNDGSWKGLSHLFERIIDRSRNVGRPDLLVTFFGKKTYRSERRKLQTKIIDRDKAHPVIKTWYKKGWIKQ